MAAVTPYGAWRSPISARAIVGGSVSVGEICVDGDTVWWSELRPEESGRIAVMRDGVEVIPREFSARTRVHEYGGGAWWVHDGVLFFANWGDQVLYRVDPGGEPEPVTAETEEPHAARFADGVLTPDGAYVVCVRELHGGPPGTGEARNEIVAIDARRGDASVLVTGPDFVSSPRLDPSATLLAWVQWDHPRMPWDGTELWVGRLDTTGRSVGLADARRVAGGPDESICQPLWHPDGRLSFLSDRTDWWTIHRFDQAGMPGEAVTHLTPIESEIGQPPWVFGQSRHAVTVDGRVVFAFSRGAEACLGVVTPDGTIAVTETDDVTINQLRVAGDDVVYVAGQATAEPIVRRAAIEELSRPTTVRAPRDLGFDGGLFSVAQPIEFDTSGGRRAHGWYYAPTNGDHVGPADELPPLIVLSHGGPTSAAQPSLNLNIQYWTSRGLAVVDVDYGGSTGYGRAYRRQLDGAWGEVDVDDCVNAARYLTETGRADPARLAIRGGSAGGFTTLAALTSTDTFAAGASLYGVADLAALAAETHKFESRYLDGLVGPWPEAEELYRQRSPIHRVDQLSCPLILFQGTEDQIVPPDQAEMMVDVLEAKGLPYAYLAFEGEQHGFRKAENIERVLTAELYFYSRVFGFTLADDVEPVVIANL